jgi:hypothetical protein
LIPKTTQMPLLIQKRFNGQTQLFDLMHQQEVTEQTVLDIDNYFKINTHRPMQHYEYTLSDGTGNRVYNSAIGDLPGFLKARQKVLTP